MSTTQKKTVSLDDEEENGSPAQNHHLMSSAKKKKHEQHGTKDDGTKNLVQGKLLEDMEAQAGRKRRNDNTLKRLSELKEAIEAEYDVMKKFRQKLQQYTSAIMKCYEQDALAQEQKIKTLAAIKTEFMKWSEDMECECVHKTEVTKLAKANSID